MYKRTNYFYIDESGCIDNDTNLFILGCIKTEDYDHLEQELNKLKDEIMQTAYFYANVEKFAKEGFHAVDNHPDIRAKLYALLPLLNYRSYFVILNKKEQYFNDLSKKYSDDIIYGICISNLLSDRIKKSRFDKNILCFEGLTFKNSTLKKVVEDFLIRFRDVDIEYRILDKSTVNLSLVDYLNYILFSIFKNTKKEEPRMNQNFELVKPKIGSIKYMNTKEYFSRQKYYELSDIIKSFDGKAKG